MSAGSAVNKSCSRAKRRGTGKSVGHPSVGDIIFTTQVTVEGCGLLLRLSPPPPTHTQSHTHLRVFLGDVPVQDRGVAGAP